MSKRLQHQFDRGDIVSLDMGSASAQAACKALVLSPAAYNVLGLALAIPITEHDSSRYAGFAVAILLPGRTPAKGQPWSTWCGRWILLQEVQSCSGRRPRRP